MRKFEVFLIKVGTLERVSKGTIMADTVDQARNTGTARYGKTGYFIAAQSV